MAPTLQQLGLDRLSLDDRLAVAQEVWDSVEQEVERVELAPEQRQELKRRLADSLAHPEARVAWEEIKALAMARAER